MTTNRVMNALKRSPEMLDVHTAKKVSMPELSLYDYKDDDNVSKKEKEAEIRKSFLFQHSKINIFDADCEVISIMQGKGNADWVKHEKRPL